MGTEVWHGSYVLVFEIRKPVENRKGKFLGRYCYVGSAFGPGGVPARVARHMRSRKPIQWHIDLLTTSKHFRPISVYATDKNLECVLARSLSSFLDGHPAFGASDCSCPTHLFEVGPISRLRRAMKEADMLELDPDSFTSYERGRSTGSPPRMLS